MNTWFALFLLVTAGLAFTSAFPEKLEALEDNLEDDEYEEEPKRPYSFSWAAARHYNGDPDREHQEQRGEDGITRGVYRYVDPRLRVQEVVYYADDQGFHVDASNLPKDTAAVQNAKTHHEELFEKIRQEHARIAAERALLESQENQYVDPRDRVQEIVYYADDQGFHVQRASNLPKETAAVQKARKYHEELFEKIRQEHARIAAERALLESQEKQYQI
ncbi:hypothetical protein O3P69_007009 [Scylla paramamosain]|uniref:Uncharacterized protein n=1 Tax=Scylla paramamosain TaxID=85552 RepID=A0AAW0V0X7_SCYPA